MSGIAVPPIRQSVLLPTSKAIKKSMKTSRGCKTCGHCIHFRKKGDDIYDVYPTCWCASRELIITWKPSTKRCDFFFDGTAVAEKISEEIRWAKADIEEWLNNLK